MKPFNVLIIDDDPGIVRFLEIRLKQSGYNVMTAFSGDNALVKLQTESPDMVILDVMMEGMDGFETLEQIRLFFPVPVIMLSARESETDKIRGLELGADDYLTKPFDPDELIARMEVIRRRTSSEKNNTVDFLTLANLTLDFRKQAVIVNGDEIPLTRIEWLLLSELAVNSGKLVLYRDILSRIWGPEYRDDLPILRKWMSRLRQKIEDKSGRSVIKTVFKRGYIIDHSP